MTKGAYKGSFDAPVLSVFLEDEHVGTLAKTPDGLAAFEYDAEWVDRGYSISPLSLPLRSGVFVPRWDPFEGLFGVFNDSLPDGWGRLLVDRMLRRSGQNPGTIDPMTRLALVGSTGMGALRYVPEIQLGSLERVEDFDTLAAACQAILADQDSSNLDELYELGGSSGGTRPKVLVELDGESWIVKFPTRFDGVDAGRLEYDYSCVARECGIDMPETRLIPSKTTPGFFAVKRFDRAVKGESVRRVHMVSASGLLETSHRIPNLDYSSLMQLVIKLTQDFSDVERLYRLMCFNVFAHNQDDHSKNFSFVQDGDGWHLSPAYDLTYSTTYGNEQSTTVNGNGRPQIDDLVELAKRFSLSPRAARSTAFEIQAACHDLLARNGLL